MTSTEHPGPGGRDSGGSAGRWAMAWMCVLAIGGCTTPAPSTPRPPTSQPAVPTPSPSPSASASASAPAGVPVATFDGPPHARVTAADGGYVLVGRHAGQYQVDSVARDGTRRWSRTLPDKTDLHADVQVGRSVVVMVQGNPARKEWPGSRIIHVYDARSGTLLWADDQPSFVTVDAKTVYTSVCHGGQNNHIGDCRLTGRDPRTGRRRWSIPTYASAQVIPRYSPGRLTPAAASPWLTVVSFPTGFASRTVTTVDPRTGRLLGTSVRTIGHIVTDEVLVAINEDDNDVEHGCKTTLTGWDPRGGGRLWRRTITGTLTSEGRCPYIDPDLVGDGQLAVLTDTGTTMLLSLATGKTTWTAKWYGEPALVAPGYVLTNAGGVLSYHDTATHSVRWHTPPADTMAKPVGRWLVTYGPDYSLPCRPTRCPTTTVRDPTTGTAHRTLRGRLVAATNQTIITEAPYLDGQTSRYAVYTPDQAPR